MSERPQRARGMVDHDRQPAIGAKLRNTFLLWRYVREPHVQRAWALALDGRFYRRLVFLSPIRRHAPWLGAEAIAYRAAIGRRRVNGFFVQ